MLEPGISRSSSWNTHCLLTRAALPVSWSEAAEAVPVIELEEFLACGETEVMEITRQHREMVRNKSRASRRQPAGNPSRIRTRTDLIAALGLNTDVDLPYVRALRPEELPSDTSHDPSREGPPGGLYVETTRFETVAAEEILCTFADEPDWGMDQDLFPIEAYGYGNPPFGSPTGKSSQAAFHMAFLHGPPVLRLLFPNLGTSFMAERVEAFIALSRLAFEKGIKYWGWRFSAWAMHYLQDLTQPYHASPFPLSIRMTVRRIANKKGAGSISRRVGTLLKNHHIFFEAVLHMLLNDTAKRCEQGPFEKALAQTGPHYRGPLRMVMEECSEVPVCVAEGVDQIMVTLFPDLADTDEGNVSVDDVVSGIEEIVNQAKEANPVYFEHWVNLICKCLTATGGVTRYALERTVGPIRK